jgi:single-stranded DNA-specific DHH superfamily exonuclease
MIEKNELKKIRELLETAQNPLFFFDNDADGLCSFILMKKGIEKGNGVVVRSFPDLDESSIKYVDEFLPDYVFILDRAGVTQGFLQELKRRGIVIVWIDHHDMNLKKEDTEGINYFNSSPSSEPVSYISYKIFENKNFLWLAIAGCISDNFIPDFAKEFAEKNSELFQCKREAFQCLYHTEIGKVAMILNSGLKDRPSNVSKMIKILIDAKNSSDILVENEKNKFLHEKYLEISSRIKKILEKIEIKKDKIYLEYAGTTSLSSELANQLSFRNKEKKIFVIFKKQDVCNISVRGKNIRELLLKAIKNIPGATGGGHPDACGARIPAESLEIFKKNIGE